MHVYAWISPDGVTTCLLVPDMPVYQASHTSHFLHSLSKVLQISSSLSRCFCSQLSSWLPRMSPLTSHEHLEPLSLHLVLRVSALHELCRIMDDRMHSLHDCTTIIPHGETERERQSTCLWLESVENHQMHCLMPSDNLIVKNSGTQAGIEPTAFGVPTNPLL